MKRHYAFIPIEDKDLSSFRKSLISSLWFRPVFCLATLIVLGIIGFFNQNALTSNGFSLALYALAIAFVLYSEFLELQKIHIVSTLRKSNLLPFIHVSKSDSSFYMEEIATGFIVQTEPVNLVDISNCKEILDTLITQTAKNSKLINYLNSCMSSSDERLINKAVIYIEIMKDQLEKGNRDILATYDKIVNFKGGI